LRLNFKTLLVVFLVALLGAGAGTFGVLEIYNKTNNQNSATKDNVVVNEVKYNEINKTDYTKAIEKAYDTVVIVQATVQTSNSYFYMSNSTSVSAGSGVIFSEDGYIVTNEHVIDGAVSEDAVTVTLYDGTKYPARIVGYDTRTDLAVLKIEANNLPYSTFADSDQLVLGQDAIAIGNPLGAGLSCSNGIVSALEKEIYINNVYMSVIQTNAAVNEGNSGGGLFDINGNLIGIVNAKKSSTYSSTTVEGMGYAIPSNKVIRIINELVENGYVKNRASLGIRVYTSNYYSETGVVVSEVIENSGADQAGMQQNDIITKIGNTEITSYADLSKALENYLVGDSVKVDVIRNDKLITLTVVLQEASN